MREEEEIRREGKGREGKGGEQKIIFKVFFLNIGYKLFFFRYE